MPSFNTFLAAAVLALVHLAVAASSQPPACLLGAIQRLPNPADLKAVCGTYQSAVEGNLTVVCTGADVSSAYSVYSATCLAEGVTVKALPTSSSESATATATGKHTAATTTATKGTASATKTGTATATGSGVSASATGESGSGLATAPQPVLFMLSGLVAIGLTNLLFL